MLNAVMTDCAAIPDAVVETLTPAHAPHALEEEHALTATAARCDWAIVIAPEFDNILLQVCERIRSTGCTLLGSTSSAIALTSDKLALANYWRERGVPTPQTVPLSACHSLPFPVVLKPRDGAGSEQVQLCRSRTAMETLLTHRHARENPRSLIGQPFVPGQAASIAFLVGPEQVVPLCPTFQHLSPDGRFTYLGGELPIPHPLAQRVVTLGQRAIAHIPGLLGFIGVDVVLGPNADGSDDVAIEINPRFTTSYVGLRAAAEFNIAEMLFSLARGKSVQFPRWKTHTIRFHSDGNRELTTTHKPFDKNK